MYLVNDIRLLFFIICSINARLRDKSLRVIGGRDAVPGEFPYAAKMEIKVEKEQDDKLFFHLCTCSLLTATWSLTSGHCAVELIAIMSRLPVAKGIVKYNIFVYNEAPYSHILKTVVHPNIFFSSFTIRNDVGLLNSEKIDINRFVKLSSVDYSSLYGNKATSLGYGLTRDANGVYDDAYSVNKTLQVLDIIVTRCVAGEHVYPQFCSGGICGKWSTACFGDSGGPVVHASGLVGIITAGNDWSCNETLVMKQKIIAFSGIITPISPYIDWLMMTIK